MRLRINQRRLVHPILLIFILLLTLFLLKFFKPTIYKWTSLNERNLKEKSIPEIISNNNPKTTVIRSEVKQEKEQSGLEHISTIEANRKQFQMTTDSHNVTDWKENFGPEKGLYNFTVVTATLDIGRGSWKHQNRTYDQYLHYMKSVLKLDVNLVVFIDPKGKTFVERMRRGRERRTKVIVTSLEELPYYKYRNRMAEIMNSSEYKKDNQLVEQKLCESYIPEYDIVTLSKLYFINRTVWENPFSTSYFIWLDGGYGHGHDIFPKNNIWIPRGLFEFHDQVTFMERSPGMKAFEDKKGQLHKLSVNILAGGFFAGGHKVLKEVCEMQRSLVDDWMKVGIVDDDQTSMMLIYYKKPSLFHPVPADWYDVFKVFNLKE